MDYGKCPRCSNELNSENYTSPDIVCGCGWSSNEDIEARASKTQRQVIGFMFVFTTMVILSMTASLHFNSLSGQVTYYQIKDRLNLADRVDYTRLAEICHFENNPSCAIDAYLKAYDNDEKFIDSLLEVARIHRELGNNETAMDFYLEYMEKPEADIDRMIEVADTLNAIGRMEEAIKMYENSLEDVSGLVNINAAKGLVRLYMSSGSKEKATKAIKMFQSKTQSASEHFSREIRALNRM